LKGLLPAGSALAEIGKRLARFIVFLRADGGWVVRFGFSPREVVSSEFGLRDSGRLFLLYSYETI